MAAFGRSKMLITSRYLEAPLRLRAFVRAHETSLVVLAALVGTVSGWVVLAMSVAVAALHALLFNIDIRERLSSQFSIEPLRAVLVPSLGGLALGLALLLLQRWRPAREIDPIEANALHGGRMSFRGSVIVALQTVWSSGVGASVGLEAGYTQLASGIAASLGRAFHLRRADQRIMVGCGAAAAISGAFGAPLAGAFYAYRYSSLQPNAVFGIPLSVEIIIRPIVGGAGTLLGPLVGSLILTPLGELSRALFGQGGWHGAHLVMYGVLLVAVVLFVPQGVVPWLRDLLRRKPA